MNWWGTAIESLVVGGLGGWGTVQGLSRHLGDRWLEGLKAKYSKELEEYKATLEKKQKQVQAEIDTSVFVTRAHFETEFQSMKDLFKVLSDVLLCVNGLRPQITRVRGRDKHRKARTIGQAASKSGEILRRTNNCIHYASPFLP